MNVTPRPYVELMCIVCSQWGEVPLCRACRSSLVPAEPARLSGLRVIGALRHETVARRLVHLLKYQGLDSAGSVLARAIAPSVPPGTTALVPVPRALVRRLRHGVDPAVVLAREVSRITGVPVVAAIAAPVWWPSHAGSGRSARNAPAFRLRGGAPPRSVLIDDVFTTGATLGSAAAIAGIQLGLTATRADRTLVE